MDELLTLEETKVKEEAVVAADAPAPKTIVEIYQDFLDKSLASVRDALEVNFPGKWEIKEHPDAVELVKKNLAKQKSIGDPEAYLKGCLTGSNTASAWEDARKYTAYTVMIHFPEKHITNSSNRNHTIKDMFIRIEFTPFLTDRHHYQLFMGKRTSFTLGEIQTNYSFSHLSGSWDGSFNHFCLGHTHFHTLCVDLAHGFNSDLFYLFCQQLDDYLSWESQEGTPYKYIKNIHEKDLGSSSTSIGSAQLESYYLEFLKGGYTPTVEIVGNDFYYSMAIPRSEELLEAITKTVTNQEHLMYWDPIKKVASPMTTPTSNREKRVKQLQRDYAGLMVEFKGQMYPFTILDANLGTVQAIDPTKPVTANPQITDYIVRKLNDRVSKYVKNEWAKPTNK